MIQHLSQVELDVELYAGRPPSVEIKAAWTCSFFRVSPEAAEFEGVLPAWMALPGDVCKALWKTPLVQLV